MNFIRYFKLHVHELFSSEWVNNTIKRYIMFQGLSQLEKIYISLLYINIKQKCIEEME